MVHKKLTHSKNSFKEKSDRSHKKQTHSYNDLEEHKKTNNCTFELEL